jgi:hypothetical protein
MPGRKASGNGKRRGTPASTALRDGGTLLRIDNSGLEVWLYDDTHLETLRGAGALGYPREGVWEKWLALMAQGVVVGYSLMQDDEVTVAVHVGPPLTDDELAVARWLEPQQAFLRLPSGNLVVESNDASRFQDDPPGAVGGRITVPPGDYRLTLYRIDHEALDRERRSWKGPQEVAVLTPGGTTADAAADLLPFEPRRDTSWVGKYEIHGNRATALAWFGDYWDTFVLNLDSPAVERLALVPGSYFRTTVPDAGLTLISCYGSSWGEAQRMRPPAGVPLDEYGYAAVQTMGDWTREAMFCRRERTASRVEDEYHNTWIPATVEVLDVEPIPTKGPIGPLGTQRAFALADLADKQFFETGFLGLILSEVLPGADDDLMLPEALQRLDDAFSGFGMRPLGDLEWKEETHFESTEAAGRLYAGDVPGFAAILAGPATIDILFLTSFDDGSWIVTGLADDFGARLHSARQNGVPNESVQLESVDESLKAIVSAHRRSLRASKKSPLDAPASLDDGIVALDRFLTAALG